MKSSGSEDRFIWLACGVLIVAWTLLFIMYYTLGGAWWDVARATFQPQSMSARIIGAMLGLIVVALGWVFFWFGNAETRKKAEMERQHHRELRETYRGILQALMFALDLRDDATYGHCQRVMQYSLELGKRLGLSEKDQQTLAWGALLHDIGKIGIPDRILRKAGPLTEREMMHMRQHVIIGYQMISSIPVLSPAADLILHHHEHYNGSGYPNGLKAEEIPLLARIFSVIDAFDAMTSPRPYRVRPYPMEHARRVIREGAGKQFCPTAVEAFLEIPIQDLDRIRREAGGVKSSESLESLVEVGRPPDAASALPFDILVRSQMSHSL